ncbi:hypothetical protein [Paenibacillus pabuli]
MKMLISRLRHGARSTAKVPESRQSGGFFCYERIRDRDTQLANEYLKS